MGCEEVTERVCAVVRGGVCKTSIGTMGFRLAEDLSEKGEIMLFR